MPCVPSVFESNILYTAPIIFDIIIQIDNMIVFFMYGFIKNIFGYNFANIQKKFKLPIYKVKFSCYILYV